ncbi:putative hydrolase of the HAD superfamily [Pyrobaculum sp. WP30]|nr:putative hydrolase of the HAD superfamily [Pyrobaculum sp. WP30]
MANIALFTDIDGTLIPPELVRSRPEVPPPLDAALRRLAELVPVAVVTTKDCGFAARTVPYAAAYACINGVEVRAGRYVAVVRGLNTAAVEEVYRAASGLEAYVDAKRTWNGELAGVTVDWRGRDTPPRGLEEVLQLAQRLGLKILRYSRHPLADVYGADVDKGEAVRLLKALLGVRHVVYMGDSENDLPAWREADVKVLIRHSLNHGLHVPGTIPVKYVDLPSYLEEAARNMTSA